MIKNLSKYFLSNQEYYLKGIAYNKLESVQDVKTLDLICEDEVETKLVENNFVEVMVSRKIRFVPAAIFELTISYGTILQFNPDERDKQNWKDIDLSKEFIEEGEFALRYIMSMISLQVAQITSSYGQEPLIIPTGLIVDDENLK